MGTLHGLLRVRLPAQAACLSGRNQDGEVQHNRLLWRLPAQVGRLYLRLAPKRSAKLSVKRRRLTA